MNNLNRLTAILLLASPLLYGTSASSKSYLDDRMTPREIRTYLQARMKQLQIGEAKGLARLLVKLCNEKGFSPETVLSLISAESGFNASAISGHGAIGLMQLMPETARFIARRDHLYFRGPKDLLNPRTNLVIGVHYLAHLRDRFDSQKELFAAYNMGPAKFRRLLTVASADRSSDLIPVSVTRYVRAIQNGVFGVKRDARKMLAAAPRKAA